MLEQNGWFLRKVRGSHHQYKLKSYVLSVQPDQSGNAKAYQIAQALDILEKEA